MTRLKNATGFLQQTGEDSSGQHKIAWFVVRGSESEMEIQRTNLVHLNIDVSRYCSIILEQIIDNSTIVAIK